MSENKSLQDEVVTNFYVDNGPFPAHYPLKYTFKDAPKYPPPIKEQFLDMGLKEFVWLSDGAAQLFSRHDIS
jgi:hypothetical protein